MKKTGNTVTTSQPIATKNIKTTAGINPISPSTNSEMKKSRPQIPVCRFFKAVLGRQFLSKL